MDSNSLPVPVFDGSAAPKANSHDKPLQADILRAMGNGAVTPEQIRQALGLSTVTRVLKELDKMKLRREYHESLERAGIDMDAIVRGVATIAVTSKNDGIRLDAFKTLMKSLGVDKYDVEGPVSNRTWEEIVLGAAVVPGAEPSAPPSDARPSGEPLVYDVEVPKPPTEVQDRRKAEETWQKSMYDV